MNVARLYFKRTILTDVAVETQWIRIPMSNTPEWKVCREYMLERMGYDSLDIKTTTLYKVKNNRLEQDRQGNSKSIATVAYLHKATKEDLKLAHSIIVSAINVGLLPMEGGNIDRWLQQQHVGQLASKLISSMQNTRSYCKAGFLKV